MDALATSIEDLPDAAESIDFEVPFLQRTAGRTTEESAQILARRQRHFEAERARGMDLIATLPEHELQRLFRLVPWRRNQEHPVFFRFTDAELETCIELMAAVRRAQAQG